MTLRGLISFGAMAIALSSAGQALAQAGPSMELADASSSDEATPGGTIIVTGTRRTDRTVTDSATPIDVYTGEELTKQGSADMNAILQSVVPSFSVGRFAIADGSSFVRPPNLRGLPPDETLVLLNGKRRHRSSLVQLGGGALSEGSHSVDLAQIPAIAVDRIEVLRDGSSAQYGSDAIAGVINIGLKRNDSGITGYARYGQYYEGDGEDYQAALNAGFALGDNGFISVSGEYVNSAHTSRGAQRPGALALQNAFPDLDVADPVQVWGNPKLEAERLFVNGGFDFGDSELYFFGNYGHSFQEEYFNYRQSVTVTGPNAAGTGTQTFSRAGVFNPIYLDVVGIDATSGLPIYDANGSTFSFTSLYPAGFTPMFFGKMDDVSGTAGYKGTFGFGVNYDFSASFGQDTLKYYLTDTINPSMGPDSPAEFYAGLLRQSETNLNADFTYPWEVGFASPVTIGFGTEYRRESYEIGLGDNGSYAIGPYALQLLNTFDAQGNRNRVTQPIGSNGFPGYGPDIASQAAQKSYAFYLDIETDIIEALTVGGAVRYEHFSEFGGTTNVKGKLRYAISDAIAIRGAASTGFRAPTIGQINTSSIATTFLPGNPNPVELATLPVTNAAAQYYGAVPLQPETSVNLTAGLVLTPMAGASLSIDYYNIKVSDRIGNSQAFEVLDADRVALQALGVTNWASLGQVQYLTNAFDTRTQGVDVVGSYVARTASAGTFTTTLGFNWNKTEVTAFDPDVIDDARIANIETQLPKYRVVLTQNWEMGPFTALVRGNYYSKYQLTASNGVAQWFGSEFVFDLEVSYALTENFRLTAGAQNIFDNYPEKDLRGGVYAATGGQFNGIVYPDSSPFGFNGGFWYVKAGIQF